MGVKIVLIALTTGMFHFGFCQSSDIGLGEQPQLSVDAKGIIRLVYGDKEKIFYSASTDNGVSFSKPVAITQISEMHLGMTRGPQLASSKNYSLVAAMDKKGNIHSFQLDHQTNQWSELKNVNDVNGSAPEGLMGITADESDNFYAVWLDLRENKRNNIAFSKLVKGSSWSENKIIYKSPDEHVCECCKPSIAVRGKKVTLMFRNWLNSSRDLYLTTSTDGGTNFGAPVKLGNGTWKLDGCPMDGGGLLIDKKNVVHTVWQRERVVYYDQPGQLENKIAEGRSCRLFGTEIPFATWQKDGHIYGKALNGNTTTIADGDAVNVVELNDKSLLAAWEKDGKIQYRKLN